MKLLLFFIILNLTATAQNEAFYIGEGNGNLIHSETKNSNTIIKHAYIFKDSIYEVKTLKAIFPTLGFSPTQYKTDSNFTFYGYGGIGHNLNYTDSIKVNNEWYKIYLHSDDDGFVGGRQNYMNKSIRVDSLGMIYSYSNFSTDDETLMLCHKDSTKQLLLNEVYKHLSETNLWFKWSKMTELTNNYKFDTCLEKMSELWLKSRCDLAITSVKATPIGNTIKYDVTLKNISKTNYVLPSYYSIAPSKGYIKVADSLHIWDIMKSHYGRHFKRVNHQYFLLPGDTVSFSQILTTNTGSSTIVKYEGFQIFSQLSFYNWLFFGSKIQYKDKEYETFKFREIKK